MAKVSSHRLQVGQPRFRFCPLLWLTLLATSCAPKGNSAHNSDESGGGGQGGASSQDSVSGAAGDGGSAGASSTSGPSRVTPEACSPGFPDDSFVPTSTYLLEAQPNIDYVAACARFWFKARDESGGYYTNVLRDGTPDGSGFKHSMTQSRNAYAFVRAFMVSGDEQFLEHAEHALDFLYSLWIPDEGGWDPQHDSFFEHYGILGPSAMCEATQDPTHCGWWDKAEALFDQKLWDADPVNFGYYSFGSPGWATPTQKGFNATADAITTHDYARWRAAPLTRAKRLGELGENLLTHLAGQLGQGFGGFGFPESFTTDWQPIARGQTFTGHVLKTAWSLSRIYLAFGDERLRDGAERSLDEVLTKVWDDSLDYRFTSRGGEPEWWELEEGFVGGLLSYYTGRTPELRARYLKLADESVAAFHRVYDDPEFGETFKVPSGDLTKGDLYKAGYHSTETGYYSLLYGQLLYQHRPVSLYYRFLPTNQSRSLQLTPIYAPQLRITAVTLDGAPYEDYDALAHRLDIDPGVGGIFKVTFWVDNTPDAEGQSETGQPACSLMER